MTDPKVKAATDFAIKTFSDLFNSKAVPDEVKVRLIDMFGIKIGSILREEAYKRRDAGYNKKECDKLLRLGREKEDALWQGISKALASSSHSLNQ